MSKLIHVDKVKTIKSNNYNIYCTLGASNHTTEKRQDNDYYATDPLAIDALINDGAAVISNPIWECACGEGHLSKRLSELGYTVYSTDLVNRGYGDNFFDFLLSTKLWGGDIVTNPPYKYAVEFIYHAMDLVSDGHKVFMFLRLQFLEGKTCKKLFEKYPPKCVYVFSGRIVCAKNGRFDLYTGTALAHAWFEFEKGYVGNTTIKWIN